ncbi:hypothetical protein GCWU000341_01024 [Oribacterium sp. oral taxon 078 str. F0262]|nr:hypothetical protein GCWU000341_01024 [Oribacterium sp. oral taxon 078 str. F0262]
MLSPYAEKGTAEKAGRIYHFYIRIPSSRSPCSYLLCPSNASASPRTSTPDDEALDGTFTV